MVDVGDPDWLHSVVGESKKVEDIRQRLAAIIDSSDDAIISKDLDGHILTWNAAAHRLLGFPASEAVGQPITIIVPPDLHEEEQGVLARLRAGERVDHFETRRIARDGRSLDVSLTISPLRDSAGTIIGALKILRDITESRRAQDGLRDTVQRLAREVAAERTLQSISTRLISESTQESLFAKILDAAMELMAADAASVQMLAADGKSLVLLASQYFHPDSAAFWDRVTADAGSTCAHALRTNTRVVVADVEMSDFMAGTTDLHEYRRSQLRAVQSTPLQSRSGRPLGMLSTHWRAPHMPVDDDFRLFDVLARQAADLIERMRTENALRESDARFRDIANTAPVTIWMSDANRLCTYVNQAWLDFTGQSLDSALGTGWMACLHPDDAPRSWAAFTRAIGTREPFHVEVRMCRHDGEYRWVISRGVPRYDSDGSFAGFIGSAIDVTESKLAEEALATINRRLIDAQDDERARIARELHDDINQRLTLVNVRLAAFAQGEPAASTGDLQKINQVREDVQRLSKDLQDLSHRLHPARLEYLGLRAAAAALCREISSQHGVRVSFEAERVPERVSRRIVISLCRVLQEALQNAIKHSGARTIDVSLVGEVDRIQMTVHDGGTGFNPRATLGGGLGLISMKERLTAVHGQLAIESAPQHGTTIRASVPLSQE